MAVPLLTPSTKISTVALASAVPVSVGVVSLVMLSLLELPLSLAEARSGVPGALTAVSMVTFSAAEAAEVLPAASLALTVIALTPWVSVLLV